MIKYLPVLPEAAICRSLCASVKIHKRSDQLLFVETPFSFNDGDSFSIFLKELSLGVIRITDCGHTLMHLSYENNFDKFQKGTRKKLFDEILGELDIKFENGSFFIDTYPENIGYSLFQFWQALNKIHDLIFLNKDNEGIINND